MLEARELQCERGGRVLFRALSFTLEPGEALRVAGQNGSGKTSLLRILCGLLTPASGVVLWQGTAIRELREDFSRHLVYLGHAPAVKDELTAAENLAIACRLAGNAQPDAAVRRALEAFGVPPDRLVKQLSQGQRRRAALARLALSASVPLWLLDEPFSALDATGVEILRELIFRRLLQGGAVAFTTHQDPGFAASRVVDLDA